MSSRKNNQYGGQQPPFDTPDDKIGVKSNIQPVKLYSIQMIMAKSKMYQKKNNFICIKKKHIKCIKKKHLPHLSFLKSNHLL